MNVRRAFGGLPQIWRDPRQIARLNNWLIYIVLIFGSLFASYIIMSRMGTQLFMMAIIGIFFGTVYTVISFGNLMIPFLVWIMSVFGFRFLWSIQTPGLPDLFLDRMTLVWLSVVFFVKFFAEKRQFRGPHVLDLLLLLNSIYILIGIYTRDMRVFHEWTMSILVPYAAYFFAKNLVTDFKSARKLLWVLLALILYYSITAIAEKFKIYFLIWPKYILTISEFWGRSNGPFGHAPIFGTIIGMIIPIHLYFIATIKNRSAKLMIYLSLMLAFGGLYFTYTRGSWLAGFMALFVTAFLNRRHYLKIVLPAIVVAPLVAVLFLGLSQDKTMKARVENEDTLGSRFGTFVTATKVWRDNPFFGVGYNQYRHVLDNYIEPLDLPIIGVITVSQFRHNPPHDIYIAYLAENGIVGVLLQGGIYFLILRTFLAKYAWRKKGDRFAIYVLPVFGGFFVGYLIGGLAIDYKFFSVVGTLFYGAAGILYGYKGEESPAPERELVEIPQHPDLAPGELRIVRPSTSQAE